MARAQTRFRLVAARPRPVRWLVLPAFVVAGFVGGLALTAWPEAIPATRDAAASQAVGISLQFPICAGGQRVTCVVDGDTFWLDGAKIRIADIDTPEVSSPACASEAELGRQATLRMRELLSQGAFELVSGDRDEDRYGRKLRVVERDGQSLGDMLVAEGLAASWTGRQHEWC